MIVSQEASNLCLVGFHNPMSDMPLDVVHVGSKKLVFSLQVFRSIETVLELLYLRNYSQGASLTLRPELDDGYWALS